MANQDMRGQVALVTGGAGGIGSGICRRLADAGAKVILTGRDVAKLEAAARALPGDDVHIVASYTQFSSLYRKFGDEQ